MIITSPIDIVLYSHVAILYSHARPLDIGVFAEHIPQKIRVGLLFRVPTIEKFKGVYHSLRKYIYHRLFSNIGLYTLNQCRPASAI